jgi:putative ABC transport system permease protein
MAMEELARNRLRTFLSLFGVTIGIFCIISILATVNSLEINIRSEIHSLGTNTIYVDKWEYSGGPDYPFWKYSKRPVPNYDEVREIKQRTPTAKYVAFKINLVDKVEWLDHVARNTRLYGISQDFTNIQPLDIQYGRFLSEAEFGRGTNAIVIGNTLAENLFGDAAQAVNQMVTIRGKKNLVAGVIKKQGTQLIGGWGFDESVLMPYEYARTIMDETKADPLVMVQGKDGVSSKLLKDDLTAVMRSVHKLRPTEADDFSLNDINDFSLVLSKVFSSINMGGWAIGALAFIVGIFGVANIMFVTVKERTAQIGIKKALGAKSSFILSEFLMESAFLCILGGLIGLLMVYILLKIGSVVSSFPIFIPLPIIGLSILISIAAGIAAGIIPAVQAARMNPVVAIRV